MSSENFNVPEWLIHKEQISDNNHRNSNTGFLRKTLDSIAKVVQNDIVSERFASRNGILQNVDPRVKLITILFFIVFSSVVKGILTLVLLSTVALSLAILSRLDVAAYIRRVWLILPPLVILLSLPAATNMVIQGTPALYIYKDLNLNYLPTDLYFTVEGIKVVPKMAARMGASLSYGYLLIMTTKYQQLIKSLRAIGVPNILVSILDMTYRYIFILLKLSVEIFEARVLRTVGKIKGKDNRRFISGSIANLFLKSIHMSEEVYNSMRCRGYIGEPVALSSFKLTGRDFIWIANILAITFVLLLGELTVG